MPPINAVMMQYFHWDYPADGSLWNQVAGDAQALADAGISALWLPPPTKAQGIDDVGYGTYDLWDFGEFDQKGGIRTKYGTRQQLDQAITAAHQAGLQVYIDVVFNHKGGADDWERTSGRRSTGRTATSTSARRGRSEFGRCSTFRAVSTPACNGVRGTSIPSTTTS
jgi:glycosidase